MSNLNRSLLVFLVILVSSCNVIPENFDWGYVIEGSYQNKFFDINWEIPENWDYDDTHAQQWAKASNPDFVKLAESAYESKFRIKMPPAQVRETLLFRLSKFKPDNAQKEHLSIFLYAENLALIDNAELKDLDDYIAQTLIDVAGNPQVTLDSEDYEKERISGTTFYKLTGKINSNNETAVEHYYFTVINGFALTILLNAPDENGIAELENALETLSL